MKRTNRKPDLIACADFHLREDQPICRTDNYPEAQWKKVDYISDLQKMYDCPVIHAGDLFEKWNVSDALLTLTMEHLPHNFWTVYGQHDLPQHNLKLVRKCGLFTLHTANRLKVFDGGHYGTEPVRESFYLKDRRVFVWHHLTYINKPFPEATGGLAKRILQKYPQYDLIITGDNHKTFHETLNGHILINPGSLMRMDADQIDHRPCVYLWYAEDTSFKIHYLPIEENVISREHIDQKEKRDNRISAFISKLDNEWQAEVSFEDNLERFKKANKIKPEIMEIIYKAIEPKLKRNGNIKEN